MLFLCSSFFYFGHFPPILMVLDSFDFRFSIIVSFLDPFVKKFSILRLLKGIHGPFGATGLVLVRSKTKSRIFRQLKIINFTHFAVLGLWIISLLILIIWFETMGMKSVPLRLSRGQKNSRWDRYTVIDTLRGINRPIKTPNGQNKVKFLGHI